MKYVVRFLLLAIVCLLLVSCSENSDENNDEVTVDDLNEALAMEDNGADQFDVEAIEEEMGIEKNGNLDIPEDIPSDVPLLDDMEIEMTIDNGLMAQVRIVTESSIDELKEVYEDYINSNSNIGEPKIDESEGSNYYYISYVSDYKGKSFTVLIGYNLDAGDHRTVDISVM